MAFTVQAAAPPLREDASGALRVGNSRVLLELVIRAFQDGATPESIVQRYSTLALADVYAFALAQFGDPEFATAPRAVAVPAPEPEATPAPHSSR